MPPAVCIILILLTWLISALPAGAAPGATVQWTTYEAEDVLINGGTVLGPQYNPGRAAAEASGRKCVQLNGTGQYIQFTNQSTANALVVRYCVPDVPGGGGGDFTLSLYTNGVLAAKLPVTSKYSWLYGSYPFSNNPTAGFARNFFDEVRISGLVLNTGTIVRLQKDSTDTALYYIIDLVDTENVPPALSPPANSLSVTNYGAVGDGMTDCTTFFQNCINAANGQGKSVWIPAGSYLITGTLNLPSNTQINGVGMWYSKLTGSPSLYTNPSRRVNLNGAGSNIKLADFAITGCLNYRNDSEGNDGLGGSFGTGSSISRIWVEHTKAAAWILNSSGLVVDSCRFRNTLADGININYAMQNTIVTNCTARGTGDDCFAIWPAPSSGNYTPGNNVITHCTGQLPFLANGGAVYGGANNRIEDSLFSDLPYGCGILFSTTFPVSFTFSGTNIAQRCDVIRCGGYDPGYGWRSAVQIVMDNYNGISGINLNNLNILDSVSSGLTIFGSAGPLANATATSVNIPDYNLNNISGEHAWWAKCINDCPSGSLTVSNSIVPEYQDDSSTFVFNFVSNSVPVTVQASAAGAAFSVDGTAYTNAYTFTWPSGSSHTIAATNLENAGTDTRYIWNSWSDGGAISHPVSPTLGATLTANFTTQYYLTLNAGAGGSVNPPGLWTNSGLALSISATPSNRFSFRDWGGTGNASYSGNDNPATITLNGPITENAVFLPPTHLITGLSEDASSGVSLTYETEPGFPYHVETTTDLAQPSWAALPGSAINATGISMTFTDTNPFSGAQRFYRAVSP